MLDAITPNTCPYCGAAYTLVAGGCVAHCAISASLKRIVRMAAAFEEYSTREELDDLERARLPRKDR